MTRAWTSSLLLSRRRALLGIVGAALVVTAGCTDDYGVVIPDGTYTVWKDDVMIGLVAVDEEITAYVTDGGPEGVSMSEWFHGKVDRGLGTLAGSGGGELTISNTDEGMSVSLDGELDFKASFETEADRGLYWGEQDGWLGAWVFSTDDDQRGAVLKRDTGELAFVALESPRATSVVLPDMTVMSVSRMTTPRKVVP